MSANLADTTDTASYLGIETGGATGGKFGGRAIKDDIVDISLGAIFGKTLAALRVQPEDNEENDCLTTDNVATEPSQRSRRRSPTCLGRTEAGGVAPALTRIDPMALAAVAVGAIAVWPWYVRGGADAAHAASLPTPAPVQRRLPAARRDDRILGARRGEASPRRHAQPETSPVNTSSGIASAATSATCSRARLSERRCTRSRTATSRPRSPSPRRCSRCIASRSVDA